MGAGGLLTIGEFARLSGLSLRALRLYDSSGLLRPAEVVEATGYRRYTTRQLYAGRLIALLRRLDMPLTGIAEILAADGPGAADRLAAYWSEVERELATRRELADRLVRGLAGETPPPPDEWAVSVRDVPEQHVRSELKRVATAGLGEWIDAATGRLTRDADATGPRFVIFHRPVGEDAEGPVEVCLPVRPDAATRTEPAHREAYIPVQKGHFEMPRILSVYDGVHRWVRDHGFTAVGGGREVYRYRVDIEAAGASELVCDVALPYR
jgi:DNA-binding transcriptional MerR regulator